MSDGHQEQVSRAAMLAMATNYKTIPQALMELIDNPIDYRGDRHLTINVIIDPQDDRIMVRDIGGEGMNEDTLREWLHWGGGHTHGASDIGQFHVGGKLACMFLAERLQIYCRRAGENVAWHFDDPEWGTRTEFIPLRITRRHVSDMSWAGRLPDDGIGFVQMTLSGLKRKGAFVQHLKARIADAYSPLLSTGHLAITVNGDKVNPYAIPWTSDIEIVRIPRKVLQPGIEVWGKVGALDRKNIDTPIGSRGIDPGIRTNFNGRTISTEDFNLNLSGRGSTRRLYGELSISGGGLLPTQNKTGWDRDSDQWWAVHHYVHPIVRGVYRTINQIAGKSKETGQPKPASPRPVKPRDIDDREPKNAPPVSPEEQAASVERRLVQLLHRLSEEDIAREEAESTAVEHLLSYSEDIPSISMQSLGRDEPRSSWRKSIGSNPTLLFNKDHPLYAAPSMNESFMLESILTNLILEANPDLNSGSLFSLLDELHWLAAAGPDSDWKP